MMSCFLATVHPHASGDSPRDIPCVNGQVGSPPREWGQRTVNVETGIIIRFTPTRVGTALSRLTNCYMTWVHPHASGDSAIRAGWHWQGSRFTPTRVGTAITALAISAVCWVHPHASGDSPANPPINCGAYGSPPREWGQPALQSRSQYTHRFTPTRVGTASLSLLFFSV